MENDIITFTAQDENGNDVELEVIAAFENTDTKKQYIIFTDHSANPDGTIRVSAAAFEGELGGKIKIIKIEDPEEWNAVNEYIEQMNKEIGG